MPPIESEYFDAEAFTPATVNNRTRILRVGYSLDWFDLDVFEHAFRNFTRCFSNLERVELLYEYDSDEVDVGYRKS